MLTNVEISSSKQTIISTTDVIAEFDEVTDIGIREIKKDHITHFGHMKGVLGQKILSIERRVNLRVTRSNSVHCGDVDTDGVIMIPDEVHESTFHPS